MRIAHVTDCYLPRLGGIELHVQDMSQRQRAAGHVVDVVTSTPEGRGVAAEYNGDPESTVRVRPDIASSAMRGMIASRDLPDLLTPERYDVVHSHLSVVSPFGARAAKLAAAAGLP
ncbi:MAG: glycosyltransferase, partial [Nocardioidaceae bacterium]